jgi:ketosteroid isomerase-like protein
VLNAPGAPPARGRAAVREGLAKDIAASSAGGFTLNPAATSDVGVSGDLGWEWNTFTVTDKSGAKVDAGKYVTVYTKKDGKWLIIRDIWNSDNPPARPPASTAKTSTKD